MISRPGRSQRRKRRNRVTDRRDREQDRLIWEKYRLERELEPKLLAKTLVGFLLLSQSTLSQMHSGSLVYLPQMVGPVVWS
jgi:hypothetical protein